VNTPLEMEYDDADGAMEDDEIAFEELDQVVGGLDRGWWPEADGSSGPSLVP
jgi:hypothetical protein